MPRATTSKAAERPNAESLPLGQPAGETAQPEAPNPAPVKDSPPPRVTGKVSPPEPVLPALAGPGLDLPVGRSPIGTALLAAQRALQSVAHDARNDYANFDYTSSEAILAAGRKALHDAGLVLSRPVCKVRGEISSKEVLVESTFHLEHPESGTLRIYPDIPMVAEVGKGKPMDKAILGAETITFSYFVRDLLMIPRPDEQGTEVHQRDDRRFEEEAAAAQAERQSVADARGKAKADALVKSLERLGTLEAIRDRANSMFGNELARLRRESELAHTYAVECIKNLIASRAVEVVDPTEPKNAEPGK